MSGSIERLQPFPGVEKREPRVEEMNNQCEEIKRNWSSLAPHTEVDDTAISLGFRAAMRLFFFFFFFKQRPDFLCEGERLVSDALHGSATLMCVRACVRVRVSVHTRLSSRLSNGFQTAVEAVCWLLNMTHEKQRTLYVQEVAAFCCIASNFTNVFGSFFVSGPQ